MSKYYLIPLRLKKILCQRSNNSGLTYNIIQKKITKILPLQSVGLTKLCGVPGPHTKFMIKIKYIGTGENLISPALGQNSTCPNSEYDEEEIIKTKKNTVESSVFL